MGFLQRLLSTSTPARLRALSAIDYTTAFWSGDDLPGSWVSALSAAGVNVTPDLAMTLSAMYCGVTTIAYDLATLPVQVFRNLPDGGKTLVRGRVRDAALGGIGDLAYLLRWAPNQYQTATEYFVSMAAQFLLRGVAYAEIADGPTGFVEQLLPRHPDRVTPERLPVGRLRYRLIDANGQPRWLTQDEMHVVRDVSTDGLQVFSRTMYGANAIGSALSAERAAAKFFKSGMTAAVVATYKGDMEDEEERALHASITRYAAGVDNTFGLLLIPDDVTISNLGIDPEKAQMMLTREWGIYEVARLLRIQPRKLMVGKTAATYASAYQDAIDHVVNCIRPVAVTFEQAIQRDLVLDKDTYEVKFRLAELLRGDPSQMGELIEKLIASRAMTPSEVRMEYLDLNPDAGLDELSRSDFQPGKAAPASPRPPQPRNAAIDVKGVMAVHGNAVRCTRKERVVVEKLARRHANDVEAWQAALRDFYTDHAVFIADTMRMPLTLARGVAAQHGLAFESVGMPLIDGDAGDIWERCEADSLATLALNCAQNGDGYE